MDVAALHRAMFDTVVSRDLDALRGLYHDDYTYAGGDGVEQKGADVGVAVAEAYLNAFSDLRLEIREQVAAGDVSVIEFTARGTHDGELEGIAPTGKSIDVVVCNVIEAADGKILREREYFDQLALLQQLGVAPS
jgi:steroid delta-isomerase-like uncharacterized protein